MLQGRSPCHLTSTAPSGTKGHALGLEPTLDHRPERKDSFVLICMVACIFLEWIYYRMYVNHVSASAAGGQKRVLASLELEL